MVTPENTTFKLVKGDDGFHMQAWRGGNIVWITPGAHESKQGCLNTFETFFGKDCEVEYYDLTLSVIAAQELPRRVVIKEGFVVRTYVAGSDQPIC